MYTSNSRDCNQCTESNYKPKDTKCWELQQCLVFLSRTNILETFLAKRMKKLENRTKLKTWKGEKEGNAL